MLASCSLRVAIANDGKKMHQNNKEEITPIGITFKMINRTKRINTKYQNCLRLARPQKSA
jgi:hypothetical protein